MWVFHAAEGFALQGTPPTDDRPNALGLTVVRLLGREGRRLRVGGVDMLDGTPVLDLKPYLSSVPEG